MYRFFTGEEQIDGHFIRITGEDVNHIRNVLRMKTGDTVYISTGGRLEYTCQIRQFTENEVLTEILYAQETDLELPARIYLFQGLPKGDKMEFIIQKAVELGAYAIIPMNTKRTVVRLDKKKEENRRKRWQSIAESAAKQAKRMIVPEIYPVHSFSEAVSFTGNMDIRLIPYEMAKDMEQTRSVFSSIEPGKSVAVFIGPEGGFAQEEIEEALANDLLPITLGRRILRTETAGMAVLSVLAYLLEP